MRYDPPILWTLPIITPNLAIRSLSHFKTRPPCSGKSALPERRVINRQLPVRRPTSDHLGA
jgi:hypothetical protein